MKNWLKIVLPIIGIAYCIAFLEIDLPGGIHQTWNDPYDTYIIAQNNINASSLNQFVNLHSPDSSVLSGISIDLIIVIFSFSLFIPFFILFYNSSGLYRKNCTFLL